ncbi:MAG: hypothetical protein R6V44_13995 [Paracoccaceae bacterium]
MISSTIRSGGWSVAQEDGQAAGGDRLRRGVEGEIGVGRQPAQRRQRGGDRGAFQIHVHVHRAGFGEPQVVGAVGIGAEARQCLEPARPSAAQIDDRLKGHVEPAAVQQRRKPVHDLRAATPVVEGAADLFSAQGREHLGRLQVALAQRRAGQRVHAAERAVEAAVLAPDRHGDVAADAEPRGEGERCAARILRRFGDDLRDAAQGGFPAVGLLQRQAVAGAEGRAAGVGVHGAQPPRPVHEFGEVGHLHPRMPAHRLERASDDPVGRMLRPRRWSGSIAHVPFPSLVGEDRREA